MDILKPPRRLSAAQLRDVEEPQWAVITRAMEYIHDPDPHSPPGMQPLSFETVYNACYKLVVKKKEDELIDKIVKLHTDLWRSKLHARLGDRCLSLSAQLDRDPCSGDEMDVERRGNLKKDELQLMQAVKDAWEENSRLVEKMHEMFSYAATAVEDRRSLLGECNIAFPRSLLTFSLGNLKIGRYDTMPRLMAQVVSDLANHARKGEASAEDEKAMLVWASSMLEQHRTMEGQAAGEVAQAIDDDKARENIVVPKP